MREQISTLERRPRNPRLLLGSAAALLEGVGGKGRGRLDRGAVSRVRSEARGKVEVQDGVGLPKAEDDWRFAAGCMLSWSAGDQEWGWRF